uniref:Uncharacterized protein n=1 Tax=Oryza sativa subsp. japonica TaxID=39947 RepID=Q5QL12_ORYSJ|nr:hypothetical protein [Oryza sativa Japonica Group]BAD73854.1 hypothetical protein [Oryza sativa Japonica Group]
MQISDKSLRTETLAEVRPQKFPKSWNPNPKIMGKRSAAGLPKGMVAGGDLRVATDAIRGERAPEDLVPERPRDPPCWPGSSSLRARLADAASLR